MVIIFDNFSQDSNSTDVASAESFFFAIKLTETASLKDAKFENENEWIINK